MTMSTHLIPVFTGALANEPAQLVNARDLHTFLEVGRDFPTWMKERIEEYGFEEGNDYSPKLGNRSDGKAGKPRTDYHLSLDMAKELAMVERNEKGRVIRRYFIECEKRLRAIAPEQAQAALTIAPAQQSALQQIVARRADEDGKLRAYFWSRFNNHFKLGSYKQLPATQFEEAVAYLEAMPIKGEKVELPQALPPIHFPAVTAMPKWDPNHMNSYGQLCLSAKNTFFNPDWADPEWLLLKLLQERGIDVNGPLISYQLKMNLIRFYEMELPDFLTNIIPGLIRGKGMFWDENWAPRH